MRAKVGIIGAGNMGLSLVKGLLRRGVDPSRIVVSDIDEGKLQRARELGVGTATDNRSLAKASEIVILAVKPGTVEGLLRELSGPLKGKLVVSIAAGIPTSFIEGLVEARVIRLMPNLCASVAEMAGCYSLGSQAGPSDEKTFLQLLGRLGKLYRIEEPLMAAVTGLSGSGPAFFFHFIGAAASAGRELGLPEEVAMALAAQTAKGAGEMLLTSEETPGPLIERVCTPGGTTIEGMKILRERKAAEALKEAVKAAARRAKELSR